MGAFPHSSMIPVSKLVKLWRAEGFLDLYPLICFEDLAKECVRELESRSIVLVDLWSSRGGDYIQSCYLHFAYRHFCIKEASKEKFLHAINRYANSFTEGIKSQRQLCIHNNVLFGIKKAHNSMGSISMAHSLLCTGRYHQYPVPICFGLRLLRVLDTLTIRFYKFPIGVLKLVRLRYLALRYSGKVPGSISKLWNLENLIIHRHISINESYGYSSYLPVEIWNMKELRHINVKRSNLPNPCGATLPNLLTLSDVSVNSCSKEILERTPNLMKLGIQIELTHDAVEPLCCFGHISHLDYLESFKCVVVNPKPRSQIVASITTFPTHLKKLSLSGLGYPWEYMRTIAKLPKLEALKLRCYAFQGPFWRICERDFPNLHSLLIEDTNLVHWRCNDICCLKSLRRLTLSQCYKLKEIPSMLGFLASDWPPLVKLVDCPSFMASLEQFKMNSFLDIYVHSSWEDEKNPNHDRGHPSTLFHKGSKMYIRLDTSARPGITNSKVSRLFAANQDICITCSKKVYPLNCI